MLMKELTEKRTLVQHTMDLMDGFNQKMPLRKYFKMGMPYSLCYMEPTSIFDLSPKSNI